MLQYLQQLKVDVFNARADIFLAPLVHLLVGLVLTMLLFLFLCFNLLSYLELECWRFKRFGKIDR